MTVKPATVTDIRSEALAAAARRHATAILRDYKHPKSHSELHAIVAYAYSLGSRDGFAECARLWAPETDER